MTPSPIPGGGFFFVEVCMTWDEMVAMQNDHLETAKQFLLDKGSFMPLGFAVTDKHLLPKEAADQIGLKPADEDAANMKYDDVVVAIPIPDSGRDLCSALVQLAPDKIGQAVAAAVEAAQNMKVDDPFGMTIKVICEQLNVHEKDLQVRVLQELLKRVKAYAFMRIDEAWTVDLDDSSKEEAKEAMEKYKSLKDAPNRKECLVSILESYEKQRIVTIAFKRDEHDTIKTFDAPKAFEFNVNDPANKVDGRFMKMLPPPPEKSTLN